MLSRVRGGVLDESAHPVHVAQRVGEHHQPHGPVERRKPRALELVREPLDESAVLVLDKHRGDVGQLCRKQQQVRVSISACPAEVALAQRFQRRPSHRSPDRRGEFVRELGHALVLAQRRAVDPASRIQPGAQIRVSLQDRTQRFAQRLNDRALTARPTTQLSTQRTPHEQHPAGWLDGHARESAQLARHRPPERVRSPPEASLRVPGGHSRDLVRQVLAPPRLTARLAPPGHDHAKELGRVGDLLAAAAAHAGPRAPDVDEPMVVGPSGAALVARVWPDGFDPVPPRHGRDAFARERVEVPLQHAPMHAQVRAAERLEAAEQQRGDLDVPRREPTVLRVQRVRE